MHVVPSNPQPNFRLSIYRYMFWYYQYQTEYLLRISIIISCAIPLWP